MSEHLADTNVGNIEYIRKDVALDALKAQADTMYKWVDRYAEQRRGILTAVNIIEDVEPADVVPVVHARWVSKPNIYGVAYCSKCDYELHTNDTNYCPNCGAKMDARGEE